MKWSRSWIGTTLSVPAILAGCAREEVVFIDKERVLGAVQLLAPLPHTTPVGFGEIRLEGVERTFDAEKPATYSMEAGERTAMVLSLLRDQTDQTLASLTSSYERQALVESAAEVAELRVRLRETLTSFDERLLDEAAALLRERSPERGRMLARLAFLAGFPPTRPRKSRVPWASALDSLWAKEVAGLKQRMEAWDDETYRMLSQMVAQHHGSREAVIATINAQIHALRESLRERAAHKAATLLHDGGQAALGELIADNPVPRAKESRAIAQVPPAIWKAPTVQPPNPGAAPPPEEVLSTRLSIFLRVHGYKLAQGPRQGRDATGEFITWLKTTQNGHSES